MAEYVDPGEWIFTFGFGHTDPETGESRANRYVKIKGRNREAREEIMRRFGRQWAFDYPITEEAKLRSHGIRELGEDLPDRRSGVDRRGENR